MNFCTGWGPTLRRLARHGGTGGVALLMTAAAASAADDHAPVKGDGRPVGVDGSNFALPADAKDLSGYGPIKVSLLRAVPAPSALTGAEAQAYSLQRSVNRAARNAADTPLSWMDLERAVLETKTPAFESQWGWVYQIETDLVAPAGQTFKLALHIDRLGGEKDVAYAAALVVAGTVIASSEGKVPDQGHTLKASFQAAGLSDLPVMAVIATNAAPATEPLKIALTQGGADPITPSRATSAADRLLPVLPPKHDAHAPPTGQGAAAGGHGNAKDKKKDKSKDKKDKDKNKEKKGGH
jgi:hypothetical protein